MKVGRRKMNTNGREIVVRCRHNCLEFCEEVRGGKRNIGVRYKALTRHIGCGNGDAIFEHMGEC